MALNGFMDFFQKGKVCIINKILIIIDCVKKKNEKIIFRHFVQKNVLHKEQYVIHYINKLKQV